MGDYEAAWRPVLQRCYPQVGGWVGGLLPVVPLLVLVCCRPAMLHSSPCCNASALKMGRADASSTVGRKLAMRAVRRC